MDHEIGFGRDTKDRSKKEKRDKIRTTSDADHEDKKEAKRWEKEQKQIDKIIKKQRPEPWY